jgi:hypothetical protein
MSRLRRRLAAICFFFLLPVSFATAVTITIDGSVTAPTTISPGLYINAVQDVPFNMESGVLL